MLEDFIFDMNFILVVLISILQTAYAVLPHILLSGGGGTLALDVYKVWSPVYAASRRTSADIDGTFEGVGSGEGIKKLQEFKYDFASSTADLPDSVYEKFPDFQMFPAMALPITLAYNIPELPQARCSDPHNAGEGCLNLSQDAIIGIYNGSVTNWNDPLIVRHNPVLEHVSKAILVVVRMDLAGATQVFTRALSAFSSKWNRTYFEFLEGCDESGKPIRWNPELHLRCGSYDRGISTVVLDATYSIGYLSTSEATAANLAHAQVQNSVGAWTSPTVPAVQASVEHAPELGTRFTGSLANIVCPACYPISGYIYYVIRKTTMTNCTVATELYRMFNFVLGDPLAQSITSELYKAPLTPSVLRRVRTHVLDELKCRGKRVKDMVDRDVSIENGTFEQWKTPVFIVVSFLIVIIILLVCFFSYLKFNKYKNVLTQKYCLNLDAMAAFASKSSMSMASTMTDASRMDHDSDDLTSPGFPPENIIVTFGGSVILGRMCSHIQPPLKWRTKATFVHYQEMNSHHVMKFLGVADRDNKWHYVFQYPTRGRIRNILNSGRITFDHAFRFSIIHDLAQGLNYLHRIGLIHGQLTTNSIYIDTNWKTVVGDWEAYPLHEIEKAEFIAFEPAYDAARLEYGGSEQYENYHRLLFWSAPEALQKDAAGILTVTNPEKPGDVYSSGIIAYEVLMELQPFEGYACSAENTELKTAEMILDEVIYESLRPIIPAEFRKKYEHLSQMVECSWEQESTRRPTFPQVVKNLKLVDPKQKYVVDIMMKSLEKYAIGLEDKLKERSAELTRVSRNMETLLQNMVPKEIADKIFAGEKVESQLYDQSTVVFYEIVNFENILMSTRPSDVVRFLADIVEKFDEVAKHFDICKIETACDSFMCVSGIPKRNEERHAEEVANFSIELLHVVYSSTLSTVVNAPLNIRIGFHTGSALGALIGAKVPRFCVFGPAVYLAARMLECSVAMRIRIAQSTKICLDSLDGYKTVPSGPQVLPGRGSMDTYWLVGKFGYHKELPPFDPADHNFVRL